MVVKCYAAISSYTDSVCPTCVHLIATIRRFGANASRRLIEFIACEARRFHSNNRRPIK